MPQKKLMNTKGLQADELPVELREDPQLCSYYIAIAWIRDGSAITIASLVTSPKGKMDWTNRVSGHTEADGEIDVSIGLQQTGSKVDLIFSLSPHRDISAAIVNIVNHTTGVMQQIAPKNGSQALTKAVPWTEILTITLP
jgi:hypothetical protein